jgi:hypothetical protein
MQGSTINRMYHNNTPSSISTWKDRIATLNIHEVFGTPRVAKPSSHYALPQTMKHRKCWQHQHIRSVNYAPILRLSMFGAGCRALVEEWPEQQEMDPDKSWRGRNLESEVVQNITQADTSFCIWLSFRRGNYLDLHLHLNATRREIPVHCTTSTSS